MITVADWRRWAIFGVLAQPGQRPLRISELVQVLEKQGWGDLLPSSGHYDAVQRAMLSMKKSGYVRCTGRPAHWMLTELGHDFAREFVVGNPNITPGRMQQERL